jgi:hypothetical protein
MHAPAAAKRRTDSYPCPTLGQYGQQNCREILKVYYRMVPLGAPKVVQTDLSALWDPREKLVPLRA